MHDTCEDRNEQGYKLVSIKDCLINLILIKVITLMGDEWGKIGIEVGV